MKQIVSRLDDWAGVLSNLLSDWFFYPVAGLPVVVLWLIAGALFFTLRLNFINIRGFRHAIKLTFGYYDDPNDPGEVSHFQALSTALSGTLGLGNIAGVAIAIAKGGPGATFWMVVAGFLGMSSKMVECTLGQMYRTRRPDGKIMGGAMCYLSEGLREMRLAAFGRVLAILFCILCIGGSLIGGNAFQVSQSLNGVHQTVPWLEQHGWVYGLVMAVLTGVVIIGGMQRIASTAEKLVPAMSIIYCTATVWILAVHWHRIPEALLVILRDAFTPEAATGGLLGGMVVGFQRAAFSNEAGIGSAAIAHSAAKTDIPVREGLVALLEPFIDTVVMCTATALIIVITGAYKNPDYQHMINGNQGSALTSAAMKEVLSFFPVVLSLSVFLFAYATLISWFYYGERCWVYLFGDHSSISFRVLFLVFTFLGAIISPKHILDLSDLMILGMAFPNILGLLLLQPKVSRALREYWTDYKQGKFEPSRTRG